MTAPEIDVAIDFRGNEIRVGDTVLYPRTSGRSCEMTEAVVEAIRDRGTRLVGEYVWDEEKGRKRYQHHEAPSYGFRLMPVRSTRFARYSDNKPVNLVIGENVVKVVEP